MFSDPVLSYRRIEKELKRMQVFSEYLALQFLDSANEQPHPVSKQTQTSLVKLMKAISVQENMGVICVGDIAMNYLLEYSPVAQLQQHTGLEIFITENY